jgi:Ca-activated chloride channel family protein
MRCRLLIPLLLATSSSVVAEPAARAPCTKPAMIVFDASGSMAGTDMNSVTPHIAKVRGALASVLPDVTPLRDLGLIVYGPGTRAKCDNIELRLKPAANSADAIMAEVDSLAPAGQTPLTRAVRDAAEVLKFRESAAEIVVLTDGEETCGGDPCALARKLKAEGKDLTMHVIGFRARGTPALDGPFQSRCLAEETGGQYLSAGTEDELVAALRKTLGCPFLTELRGSSLGSPYRNRWSARE